MQWDHAIIQTYIRLCSQIIKNDIFVILISTCPKSVAKVMCSYIYICPFVDGVLDEEYES